MSTSLLDQYQSAALTTAIYPKAKGLEYTALGLCGEIGEIAGKVRRWDFSRATDRDDALAELGDVCWFIATHAHELGEKMSILATYGASGAFLPKERSNWTELKQSELVLIMAEDGGEIAGKASKVIRDGRSVETIRDHQLTRLGSILICVAALASHAESSIWVVLEANLAKLSARKSKGTLTGDGDKR